jgi:hypothetical protein
VAKLRVYNPPPNWPPPPPGWTPPAGWEPDPAWGPAPEGWTFWDERRANPRAWGYAFLGALTVALAFFALGALVTGGVPSPELFGIFIGRALVVGVVVGLIAHVSTRHWPEWLYLPVALAAYAVVTALGTIGGQGSAG